MHVTQDSQKKFEKDLNLNQNKGGGPLPDFKAYQAAVIKRVAQYWHKDREIDQWNRIESPIIDSHIYNQLNFKKV